MKVDFSGKTNFHFKPTRHYVPEKVPSFDGTYSVNIKKVHDVLELVGSVEIPNARGYLLTQTFIKDFDNEKRYELRKAFLDVLRKKDNVLMYVWVTELHKKGELAELGYFHFHYYIIYRGYWDYVKDAERWSNNYTGNSNGRGIDIRKHDNPGYLRKYLLKDRGALTWNKRLWGYKGLTKVVNLESPVDYFEFYVESRACCHIVTGRLKLLNKKFLAKNYMCKTDYDKYFDSFDV